MTIQWIAGDTFTCESTDTKPTNVPTHTKAVENNTDDIYRFNGTTWVLFIANDKTETLTNKTISGSANTVTVDVVNHYSWLVYKAGSNFKAKSGYTGAVPAGAISTSLDTVLAYVKANFIQSGEDTTGLGGILQFQKGTYPITSTSGLVLDDNWGNSVGGLIVQGTRNGTVLQFTPASAATNGITIEKTRDAHLRDLAIEINNNVVNAIKIEAITADTLGTTLKGLRILNATTAPPSVFAGQTGILLQTDNNTPIKALHNTVFDDIYIRGLDTAIDAKTLSTANKNTSFLNMTNIKLWKVTNGININDYSHSNRIAGVQHQDVGGIANYTISLGHQSDYCQVSDIQTDALTKTGAAAVILNGDARFNKVQNVINTGGTGVLDFSGNSLNEIINVSGIGVPNIHGRSRSGMLAGNSISTWGWLFCCHRFICCCWHRAGCGNPL